MTWPQWVLVAYLVLQYIGGGIRLAVDTDDRTPADRAATVIAAAIGTVFTAWLIYLVTTL